MFSSSHLYAHKLIHICLNFPILVAYSCICFIFAHACIAGYHEEYKYCTLEQQIF